MTHLDEAAREVELAALVAADPWRMAVLRHLRAEAPDAWIAAGFVRNLVWDAHFGDGGPWTLEDVDVLIMDNAAEDARAPERDLQAALKARAPDVPWSVKNQARMHLRNKDRAYTDIPDAMTFWLETATGVAVRLNGRGLLDISSAYGLADLMAGILRPTTAGEERPHELFRRIHVKGWDRRWPGVRMLVGECAGS